MTEPLECKSPRFAEVAVNSPISRGTASFHYALPPGANIAVGQLVLVPFGSNQMQGVVLALLDAPDVATVKEISCPIDPRPVLNAAQVALARWIAAYYHASLFDAIRLMLPSGLTQQLVTRFELTREPFDETALTAKQRAVVDLLRNRGPLAIDQLRASLKLPGASAVAGQLVRRRLLRRELELRGPRVAPKLVRYLALAPQGADEAPIKGEQQAAVIELLRRRGAMPQADVVKEAGCTGTTITALLRQGAIVATEREVRRDPLAGLRAARRLAPALTSAQREVWREIEDALDRAGSAVFLLHGVTGSGKTELYLRAVERVALGGGQAIVLVPEIALTPQTIHRFAARFPGLIAVLHSKLSQGERYDEWRRIRDGEAAVVIGPRSALFAPAGKLGLIVLDEEHEWSYKQDKVPRYHARETALQLAALTGAKVILGSATPDVESYHRAEVGRYRLLRLTERVLSGAPAALIAGPAAGPLAPEAPAQGGRPAAGPPLPPVQIVDMRDELRSGNRSIFSRALHQAVVRALDAREQVILFLNRRGTASFVLCRDCGLVLQCRYCDFSLVYHGDAEQLVCHQCNYRRPVPSVCPECSGSRIKFFRAGTQKVEEEARREFPQARVMRWDRDVTRGKLAHEDLMKQFAGHEADILVGTQMIAKGLDLPLVTVVGVISADVAMHLPDPRAGERTFQLLTQVAGRAGRGALPGRAIVQTYSPGHYGVQAASRHDFEGFYRQEIEFRRQHAYPPFGRLARLVYSVAGEAQAQRASERLAEVLRLKIAQEGIPGTVVFGPAPAYHRRIRGKYRWQLFIRGAYVDQVLDGVPTPLGWVVDVDPYNML